jgi:serine/threonine protein phosphatase PrpC
VTQNLLEEGVVTEQQMGVHPDQNILMRSINVLKTHQPEIKVCPPAEKGETFILCSDGFWEFTKPNEFQRLAMPDVQKKDLKKQAQLAVLRARGRSDNVTVQWLRMLG